MDSPPAFEPFGFAHLVVIALTILVPLAFASIARRTKSSPLDRAFATAIAALLIVNYVGYIVFRWRAGAVQWEQMLPFQLCDWTMFAVIVALLKSAGQFQPVGGTGAVPSSVPVRDATAVVPPSRCALLEVAYFWGIGGSLQAIATPNLAFGFPDFRFLSFFADHCGIVMGVLYLMISRRFRPTVNSIWRTLAWSEVYLVVTLLVDHFTGVNYGFLLHKPEAFSILSYLSDWRPLYILQMNGLAILFFAVLYAPFAIADLARKKKSA
jgi:uncharacterized membrane protein YwaF